GAAPRPRAGGGRAPTGGSGGYGSAQRGHEDRAAGRGAVVPLVRGEDREAGGPPAGRERGGGAVQLGPHRGGARPERRERRGPRQGRGAGRVHGQAVAVLTLAPGWRRPAAASLLAAGGYVLAHALGGPAASVGSSLLLAAAALAGWPVAVQAWRALAVRVVGIDLLVSVAAVGAVAIGELWEAAAVTTLFAVGKALEGATLDRTRGALRDLVASAPERAVVVRGGRQVEVPASEVRPGETVVVR